MKNLILFGGGDIAQLANFYFQKHTDYKVVGFTMDGEYVKEKTYEGLPVIPFEEIEKSFPAAECDMHIALSYAQMNRLREKKYHEAKAKGYKLATYISPKCSYMSQFEPGDNCFIYEDNTIQPYVRLGSNIILWSGNHIGHHSVIHDHNFVSSHVVISGHCTIESNCFLGVNSSLAHKVKLASGTLLGAGTIISKDTEVNGVYVPARSTKIEKTSDQITL
jgi:sugar O-acyltransferase (sialic acid O-acetyltransferase NeuD family)